MAAFLAEFKKSYDGGSRLRNGRCVLKLASIRKESDDLGK